MPAASTTQRGLTQALGAMSSILVVLAIAALAYFLWRKRFVESSGPSVQGHLPGPGTYEFDIVGESKYQDVLEAICGGRNEDSAEHITEAVLYLEDSNPYDNLAVRVDIDGRTVGYLSRKDARSYRQQLKQLGHGRIVCKCDAMVVGGWRRSRTDQGHFGVKLDLPVA
jgi:hypothetical protein